MKSSTETPTDDRPRHFRKTELFSVEYDPKIVSVFRYLVWYGTIEYPRQRIVNYCMTLWGARLSAYLYARRHAKASRVNYRYEVK